MKPVARATRKYIVDEVSENLPVRISVHTLVVVVQNFLSLSASVSKRVAY